MSAEPRSERGVQQMRRGVVALRRVTSDRVDPGPDALTVVEVGSSVAMAVTSAVTSADPSPVAQS